MTEGVTKMNSFFEGKIVFHFEKHEKTFEFKFSPQELCFQKVLVPIFLNDLNIPKSELKYLTKETRSLILKIKNVELDLLNVTCQDLAEEFKLYGQKVTKIEAYGVGSIVALSLPIKDIKVTCVDCPYTLLPQDIKRKLPKKNKINFKYTDTFILKPFNSLCPTKDSTKKTKRKVAA